MNREPHPTLSVEGTNKDPSWQKELRGVMQRLILIRYGCTHAGVGRGANSTVRSQEVLKFEMSETKQSLSVAMLGQRSWGCGTFLSRSVRVVPLAWE